MDEKPFVFLGMPHHTRQVDIGAAKALYGTPVSPTSGLRTAPTASRSSLLARAFNSLWCQALDLRKRYGFTHFAMVHSDVDPEMWWLSTMYDEMNRVGADVLSAVIPIKGGEGLTSTGLIDPFDQRHIVRRLTLREVHGRLPETFGAKEVTESGFVDYDHVLAVNTGLWVCDIRKPWVEDFPGFTIRDEIDRRVDEETGEERRFANADPEDWGFSKWLHDHHVRYMATRKVRVEHHGDYAFSNDEWGAWSSDHAYESIRETGIAVDSELKKIVDAV